MDFIVNGRDIQLNVQDVIAVQEDTNTQTIKFVLNKSSTAPDLSDLNVYVLYRPNGAAGVNFDIVKKEVSDTQITAVWTLTRSVTHAQGKLEFQLVFSDSREPLEDGGTKRWATKIVTVNIPKSLLGEPFVVPVEPILAQMLEIADRVQNSEDKAVNSAKIAADNAAKTAVNKTASETAANRAEAAKIGIETARDIATTAATTATTQAQTAQLEAQKVKQIVAGNEAYTKTKSDLKYTVAPRKKASSSTGELKLTDADDGLSYLELQGNSEQYTNTASTNLFDMGYQKSLGLDGTNKYLKVNGEVETSGGNGWSYSYYIKVKQNTLYSARGLIASTAAAIVFYNKDKAYISGISINDAVIDDARAFTTPTNCEWARISYGVTLPELYEGALQSSVTGAVETPSPEYPSEVRSVGDIPKDVNGVEIRNLLDEEWIKSQPESAWERIPNEQYNYTSYRFILPDMFKKRLTTMGHFVNRINNSNNYRVILTNKVGTNGAYFLNRGVETIGNADYTNEEIVYFYIFIHETQAATFQQAKEILDNMNLMITEASEIDEYRPCIGENNGLVKIENAGMNFVNSKDISKVGGGNSSIVLSEDGSSTVFKQTDIARTSYIFFDFKYEANKTYTVYCRSKVEVLSGSGGGSFIGIRKKDMSEGVIQQVSLNPALTQQEIYFTFNVSDKKNLGFLIYLQSQASTALTRITVINPMIVEGEKTLQEMKALKYQPYHQQITWIPLREPLQGLYGVKDTVDKNGYVTKKFDSIETRLDICIGKSGWNERAFAMYTVNESTKNFVNGGFAYSEVAYLSKEATAGKPVMITTQGFNEKNGWYFGFWFLYGYLGLSKTSTDAENKQKILGGLGTGYKIKAWYQLKEPITYQIPAVYIETYDQETNVRCLNKVKPSDMTLDYKIAMSSLIKRLEALEAKTIQEV